MTLDFQRELPWIADEYTHAHFDPASGMAPEALRDTMLAWASAHQELPEPLIRAGLFDLLLSQCRLEINPHTPFAEKICHGVVYRKDNASGGIYEQIVNDRYRDALSRLAPEAWELRQKCWACGAACPDVDVWHICPDWGRLLSLGFPGLRQALFARREERAAQGKLTQEQAVFYEAALQEYDAALGLLGRLEKAARAAGAEEYAQAVAALSVRAPQTLYEALTLSHLYLTIQETGKERARTYGPVDQLWYPFYQRDLAQGRLTAAQAADLFRFFFIKIAAEQRFADQPICLGTVNPDGTPGPVAFSCLLLDCYDELGIHNPKIHVRCAKNMDRDFLKKLLDMIRRGHSSIVLINDEAVYAAYEKIGVGRAAARAYLPIGCYEPVLPGIEDARICSSWINLSKAVEWTINGGENTLPGEKGLGLETPLEFPSFAEFEKAFARQLTHLIALSCDILDGLYPHQYAAYAAPFLSGAIASCVEKGKDVFNNGMEIRNLSLKCFAIGTAVDSLLGVKELVYERGLMTLEELRKALRENWAGREKARLLLLRSRRKWGNHVREADELGKKIYDLIWDYVKARPTPNGGCYRIGCDSVAQADYGHRVGATADGRLAGALLSKNMRPTNGMERAGVTALIQSVASLDASRFADAAPLDFWLHPSAVAGSDGLNAFAGLVDTFFALGGFALHGNVLSAETLLDAQQHPENHQNLQIRVCGWNEYFINLSRELQDDFIQRSQGIETA